MGKNTQIEKGIAISQPTQSEVNVYLPAGVVDESKLALPVRQRLVPLGVPMPYFGQTAPVGAVLACGRTLGNIGSGATERANSDTQELFVFLWNNIANTEAPVSGGRGASAIADFNALKTIVVPDVRGRALYGLDNMGGSAANRVTVAGSGVAATSMAAAGGAQTHTLTSGEMPSHTHIQNAHTHSVEVPSNPVISGAWLNADGGTITNRLWGNNNGDNTRYSGNVGAATAVNQDTGGGQAHNNMPPAMFLNYILFL